MSLQSRRTVLRWSCLLGTSCLSGCLSSFQNRSSEPRLSLIEIHNNTEDEQTILITIKESNEVVYKETLTVPPSKTDGPSISYASELPEGPGSYSVYFDIDQHRDDEQGEYHDQIGETDIECKGYILSIRPEDGSKLVVHQLSGCDISR